MNEIVCPLRLFRELLLIAHRGEQATVRVGVQRTPDGVRWLFRSPPGIEGALVRESAGPGRVSASQPAGDNDHRAPRFFVTGVGAGTSRLMPFIAPPLIGILVLGRGEHEGEVWAAVRTERGLEPLERLVLPGPGMHEITVSGAREATAPEPIDIDAWSRTIGALGGEDVWWRFRRQTIALVGCGRSGSLMAESLARSGAGRLLLIDADRLERSNLGEMAVVSTGDVGELKVEVLARELRQKCPHTEVTTLVEPITSSVGLALASTADVVVLCVDNDAARLAAGILAAAYHKVLLDVGTLIPPERSPAGPHAEADIRVILPDDPGCLLCCGGLSDQRRAVEDICLPEASRPPQDRFGEARRGSLRSLNMLAVSIGIHMLQAAVAGRLESSRWARLRAHPSGEIAMSYPELHPVPGCSLCLRAGIGDAAALGLPGGSTRGAASAP